MAVQNIEGCEHIHLLPNEVRNSTEIDQTSKVFLATLMLIYLRLEEDGKVSDGKFYTTNTEISKLSKIKDNGTFRDKRLILKHKGYIDYTVGHVEEGKRIGTQYTIHMDRLKAFDLYDKVTLMYQKLDAIKNMIEGMFAGVISADASGKTTPNIITLKDTYNHKGIRNDTKDKDQELKVSGSKDHKESQKEKNKENLHTCEGTRTLAGTEPYAGTRNLRVTVKKSQNDFSFSSSESSTDQEPDVKTQEPCVHVYDVDDYDSLNADVVGYGMRLNGKSNEEQASIKSEFEKWINGLEFSRDAIEFDMRDRLVTLFESYSEQYNDSYSSTAIPDEWDNDLQPIVENADTDFLSTVSGWTKTYILTYRTSSSLEKHLEAARQRIKEKAPNDKSLNMAMTQFNLTIGEKIRELKAKEFFDQQAKDASQSTIASEIEQLPTD